MSGIETPEIKYFSIGLPKTMIYENDKEMITGICKEAAQEVFLTYEGFQGDGVADLRFHGGPDRAVCLYPYEHYSLWEQEFDKSLSPAAFGENLTVTNMPERDVYIGDMYQVGDAVIQITQARNPCSTINKRTHLSMLLKRMIDTGYTGYFGRVIKEGKVRKDSKITLLQRHPKQVSILFANQVYFHMLHDREAVNKLLDLPELAIKWRDSLIKRVSKD
jgi:MOSC domain-containing protein YiiM